jgi:hypothetical protein
MGVPSAAVQGLLIGLIFNGTVADTGDRIPGEDGRLEPIYSFVPLPPGPKEHPVESPEWRTTPGVYDLAPERGRPVVLDNRERDMRIMAIPGARQRLKMRKVARERLIRQRKERKS